MEALEFDSMDESGWKLLHGDVGRPPRYLNLFAGKQRPLRQTVARIALALFLVVCCIEQRLPPAWHALLSYLSFLSDLASFPFMLQLVWAPGSSWH